MRLVLAFWISICGAAVSWADAKEVENPDPNRFAKEIASFAEWDSKNAIPAHPILFVGSSSIRMWKTHESFPQWPVVNRGFGGSHISDVVHFSDRIVVPYAPKLIVFYAGDNDVGGGKSASRVLCDYKRFVELVQAKLPDTAIVFIGIKPSGKRWALWPEMNKANNLIKAFSEKSGRLFFADLGTPLLAADGKPDDSLFRDDRLHLNPKGYHIWTETLTPIIEEALQSGR